MGPVAHYTGLSSRGTTMSCVLHSSCPDPAGGLSSCSGGCWSGAPLRGFSWDGKSSGKAGGSRGWAAHKTVARQGT